MNTQQDIAQVVDAIQRRAFTQDVVKLLTLIINHGNGSQLLSALIASERTLGKTEEDAISQTMLNLEALAETSEPVACILMAYLRAVPSHVVGMHDVYNAIDLWIVDCHSDDLTNWLKQMIEIEKDTIVRRHFESLIQYQRRSV